MTVRIGTGSAAVDPSTFRVGGVLPSRIMLGTGTAAVEVWPPPLVPYYKRTDTAQTIEAYVWATLDETVVAGAGQANISAGWRVNSTGIFWGSPHVRAVRLMLNGAQVGHWDHGGNVVQGTSWESTGSVLGIRLNQGDALQLQGQATAANEPLRTFTYRWLQVTQA